MILGTWTSASRLGLWGPPGRVLALSRFSSRGAMNLFSFTDRVAHRHRSLFGASEDFLFSSLPPRASRTRG